MHELAVVKAVEMEEQLGGEKERGKDLQERVLELEVSGIYFLHFIS